VPHLDPDTVLIDAHRAVFDDLIERVRLAVSSNRGGDAACTAAVAADFASRQHPGIFASQELELMLGAIGSQIAMPPTKRYVPSGSVVHVVDADARSSISSTIEAIDTAIDLPSTTIATNMSSPVRSATALRKQTSAAELVFVHVEPHDIVPSVAFGGWTARPPVIHVNHHETVFWSGVGVADLVMSHQAAGTALAIERRFVGAGRTGLLPRCGAGTDVWAEWASDVLIRASSAHRASLPAACLPTPIDVRDVEHARLLARSGRSDGLRSSWRRYGDGVSSPVRPEMSVIVVGREVDAALGCVYQLIDVAQDLADLQLLVLDVSDDPALAAGLADLRRLVTVIHEAPHSALEEAVAAIARWSAATVTAVVSDDVRVTREGWIEAIAGARAGDRPVLLRAQVSGPEALHFIAPSWHVDGWLDLLTAPRAGPLL
jgi:hypothetical protein